MTVPLQVPLHDFQQHDVYENLLFCKPKEERPGVHLRNMRTGRKHKQGELCRKRKQSLVCFELAQVWWHQFLVGFLHV